MLEEIINNVFVFTMDMFVFFMPLIVLVVGLQLSLLLVKGAIKIHKLCIGIPPRPKEPIQWVYTPLVVPFAIYNLYRRILTEFSPAIRHLPDELMPYDSRSFAGYILGLLGLIGVCLWVLF
ncbi:MAG: hypothetical protein AAF485_16125 [Chloroflexota bacterium]